MFGNNFGKYGLIFKILLLGDLQENSLCTHHKDFHLTCNMLLHYLKYCCCCCCESRESRKYKNVTKFSR